jgi:hypothetical protein
LAELSLRRAVNVENKKSLIGQMADRELSVADQRAIREQEKAAFVCFISFSFSHLDHSPFGVASCVMLIVGVVIMNDSNHKYQQIIPR